ncbi:hypothetical protein EIP91_011343, partial [Steccherinum ochraceum]
GCAIQSIAYACRGGSAFIVTGTAETGSSTHIYVWRSTAIVAFPPSPKHSPRLSPGSESSEDLSASTSTSSTHDLRDKDTPSSASIPFQTAHQFEDTPSSSNWVSPTIAGSTAILALCLASVVYYWPQIVEVLQEPYVNFSACVSRISEHLWVSCITLMRGILRLTPHAQQFMHEVLAAEIA